MAYATYAMVRLILVITRDNGYFKFASLQSTLAKDLKIQSEPLESIILVENRVQYTHSTAALKSRSICMFRGIYFGYF